VSAVIECNGVANLYYYAKGGKLTYLGQYLNTFPPRYYAAVMGLAPRYPLISFGTNEWDHRAHSDVHQMPAPTTFATLRAGFHARVGATHPARCAGIGGKGV
jgi:hypothetical protein